MVSGTKRDDELATPGCRTAKPGAGGGGMSWVSERILGMPGFARWALCRAGKAGGSSLFSLSVASPSSSESGGEMVVISGADSVNVGAVCSGAPESQLRRKEVI